MDGKSGDRSAVESCAGCKETASKLSVTEVQRRIKSLCGWQLVDDDRRIRKDWKAADFQTALEFFALVGQLAEQHNHHPDLHLERYRHVWIALWTHAVGGVSEQDFDLAAKIDELVCNHTKLRERLKAANAPLDPAP